MKEIMPQLIGNRALAERLKAEILAGKMSHAYIIYGEAGTGKHTLARQIAAALACENRENDGIPLPCGKCESCRKIFARICPDVNIIGRGERATIGVEIIRDLRLDVLRAPNDLDIKVYIIEDADKMTLQAQNAFLLTLEEPPSYVLFLLLCESTKELLPTVKSRAPMMRTEPVSADDIEEFLVRDEAMERLRRTSPEEFYDIIMASFGSIGKALTLCDPEKRAEVLTERDHVKRFVKSATGRPSGSELVDILQKFPTARAELTERISLIILALRDLAVLKKSEDAPLCFYHDREEALALSDSLTLSSLLSLISACDDAKASVLHNANIKLTITNLVMR